MKFLISVLSLLGACKSGQGAPDSELALIDSAQPDDSDSQPADDSQPNDDSQPTDDSGLPLDDTLGFVIEGPWEGSALELRWIDTASTWPFAYAVASAANPSAAPSLQLSAPPPEQLTPLGDQFPGVQVAFYAPALFADPNGDGQHDPEEPYLGVSPAWAMWLEGDLPKGLEALGLKNGWNAIDNFSDANPIVLDPKLIPVASSLWANESLTLAGAVHPSTTPSADLHLWATAVFTEGSELDPLYADLIVEDAWTLEFSGPSPVVEDMSWFTEGAEGLTYDLFAWWDESGAEDPYSPDAGFARVCSAQRLVFVMHLEAPTQIEAAWTLSVNGWTPGWLALSYGPEGQYRALNEAEAHNLNISDRCL